MTELKFRKLTPEDVECRVCNSTEKMINLLIYKNARVDMAILNETVGMRWKREHNFKGNVNYCTVSIWDTDNNIWVSREDCGVESATEAEKGQSSDAFKRACFNWGIGTELYTGPRISIYKEDKDIYNSKVTMTFNVTEMEVNDDKKITHLVIVDKDGKERFRWDKGQKETADKNAPIDVDKTIEYMKDYCRKEYLKYKDTDAYKAGRISEFVKFYSNKLTSGSWSGRFNTEALLDKWLNKKAA